MANQKNSTPREMSVAEKLDLNRIVLDHQIKHLEQRIAEMLTSLMRAAESDLQLMAAKPEAANCIGDYTSRAIELRCLQERLQGLHNQRSMLDSLIAE